MTRIDVLTSTGSVSRCVIVAIGEVLTSPSRELIGAALDRAAIDRHDPRPLIFDLSGLTWMNTSGLEGLIAIYLERQKDYWRTVIVCPSAGRIRTLFHTTKLDTRIPIYETRESALAALSVTAPS